MRKRGSAKEAELAEACERTEALKAQKWFKNHVTYEGEAYTMDIEQAAAVVASNKNIIVVARAGSGKTRTIVAKIVYLVARCQMRPEEIIAFVFNANAAAEINERLSKMLVDGKQIIDGAKVAWTFHAFSRHIIYNIYGGRERCGKILAGEKDAFVQEIVRRMKKDKDYREMMETLESDADKLASEMIQFINRAQQRYLGDGATLSSAIRKRLAEEGVTERERLFLQIGEECYKRYHWFLLNEAPRCRLARGKYKEYGTDFNLVVSWASKILAKSDAAKQFVAEKKCILIDEYQDFSQLFLSVVLTMRGVIPDAQLFVVGDDWQAINRFAGSDVEYFKEFKKFFPGDTRWLSIATNYRCDYSVVETARCFMQKAMDERGDFRAYSRRSGKVVVVNPRETMLSFGTVEYNKRMRPKDKIYITMARRIVGKSPKRKTAQYFKAVMEILQANRKAKEILLLHRNNETNIEGASLEDILNGLRWGASRLGMMGEEEFDDKVRIMTMHKSKGLEAEVVIILEADEGVIPKTHPDVLLYSVFGETNAVVADDQKRLFYVAMTRAKKRLYIIHDEATGEGFVKYLGRMADKWEK